MENWEAKKGRYVSRIDCVYAQAMFFFSAFGKMQLTTIEMNY